MTRLVSLLAASALGASALAVALPVTTAGAAGNTVTACVKKKTGQVQIRTGAKVKKKCKKGWKKVRWNNTGAPGATGPQGDTGARGPQYWVTDGAGNSVGQLIGTYPGSPIYSVLTGGALYTYLPTGQVFAGGSSPSFKAADCTGPVVQQTPSAQSQQLAVSLARTPNRVVYRPSNPSLGGPIRSWAFTSTVEALNQNLYELDDTGACVLDLLYVGNAVALESVTPPVDVAPPLTLTQS